MCLKSKITFTYIDRTKSYLAWEALHGLQEDFSARASACFHRNQLLVPELGLLNLLFFLVPLWLSLPMCTASAWHTHSSILARVPTENIPHVSN